MKKKDFFNELDSRLEENRLLSQSPGLGAMASGFSSFVGLHAFWILLVVSLLITFVFVNKFDGLNGMLFGFLYE